MDSLVRKIKKLQRITPSASWLESQRSFLLYEIGRVKNQKQEEERKTFLTFPVFSFFNLKRLFRPAFAVALASVIIISSISTVGVISASQNTLPGDFLYPVKTAIEKTQLTFSSGTESRTKLSVKFASQRIDEFSQLMDKTDKGQNIGTTVKKFTQEMVTVQQNINTLKEQNVEKAVEMAKLVQTQTPVYEDVLTKSAEKLSYILPDEREQLTADINQALQEVSKTKEITDKLAEEQTTSVTNDANQNQNPGEIITPITQDKIESSSIPFESIQEPASSNPDTIQNTQTQIEP